jgi:hypothetical protein
MTPQEFNYTFRIEKVSFPYLTEKDTVYRIRQRNITRKFNWSLFKFEKVESWDKAPMVYDELINESKKAQFKPIRKVYTD